MDGRALAAFKKLEETFGTRKVMKSVGLAAIGFFLGLIILPDDIEVEQNNLLENNKEEF